jgi:PAS domain S-box-containing protein
MRQIPREICEKVLTHFDIGKLYVTGLVWEDQLFGVAGIFMAPGETLEYRGVVESFLRQASLAIARQQMAGRLHRSEKRFREVMDLSPFPSALIDGEGRYISINRKFTDVFGYTIEDIPTGKIWFPQAFPDPGMRKEAITAWKDDPGRVQEGPMTPRTFDVRCKDGTMKTILFRPVTLHDGSHFVTCEDLTIH